MLHEHLDAHSAAVRIVEIQGLSEQVLGTERRSNLFEEQKMLWDDFFLGQPFEYVAGVAASR